MTPQYTKRIAYNQFSKDFDAFLAIDGTEEQIGSYPTHHAAEVALDEKVFELLQHCPEVLVEPATTCSACSGMHNVAHCESDVIPPITNEEKSDPDLARDIEHEIRLQREIERQLAEQGMRSARASEWGHASLVKLDRVYQRWAVPANSAEIESALRRAKEMPLSLTDDLLVDANPELAFTSYECDAPTEITPVSGCSLCSAEPCAQWSGDGEPYCENHLTKLLDASEDGSEGHFIVTGTAVIDDQRTPVRVRVYADSRSIAVRIGLLALFDIGKAHWTDVYAIREDDLVDAELERQGLHRVGRGDEGWETHVFIGGVGHVVKVNERRRVYRAYSPERRGLRKRAALGCVRSTVELIETTKQIIIPVDLEAAMREEVRREAA